MGSNDTAVVIARVSSKRQEDEGYSLPAQKKLLNAYAVDRSIKVLRSYEIAESASKSEQRRIFQDAMQYIEDNKIRNLIVEKVDRHVRNLNDAVETHDWLMSNEDRRVHFVKDSLVMHKNSRSQEWLNWGIRVVMAKNYIDNLREEAMKGWAEKLSQGWLPAPPPAGYVTITHHGKRIHVPDDKRKHLIRHAFELYLEPQHSIASIAEALHRMGITTRAGRPINKSKVQKMLTNPFYIGINRFDGKDYPGAQETFIDKQLFDRVQAKMKRKTIARYRKHNPTFKNLITCDSCNHLVTWQLQKGKYYGICQRKLPACKQRKMLKQQELEDKVVEMLKNLISPSPKVLGWVSEAMISRNGQQIKLNQQLAQSLNQQIERIERMDSNLYDDKIAGEIDRDLYVRKHEDFTKQLAQLQAQLSGIDLAAGERLQQQLVLFELTQKAAEIYATRTTEQKRLIITKLFDSIVYKGDSVSVNYTNFTRAVAHNVEKSYEIIGGRK